MPRGYQPNTSRCTRCSDFSAAKVYPPTIVYGFLGMELVAALAGEAKHPRRDMIWSIPVARVRLTVIQILVTVDLLLVIPLKVPGLTTGMIDTGQSSTAPARPCVDSGHHHLVYLLLRHSAVDAGADPAAVEAAHDGELPKAFGRETRWDTPLWAPDRCWPSSAPLSQSARSSSRGASGSTTASRRSPPRHRDAPRQWALKAARHHSSDMSSFAPFNSAASELVRVLGLGPVPSTPRAEAGSRGGLPVEIQGQGEEDSEDPGAPQEGLPQVVVDGAAFEERADGVDGYGGRLVAG